MPCLNWPGLPRVCKLTQCSVDKPTFHYSQPSSVAPRDVFSRGLQPLGTEPPWPVTGPESPCRYDSTGVRHIGPLFRVLCYQWGVVIYCKLKIRVVRWFCIPTGWSVRVCVCVCVCSTVYYQKFGSFILAASV